EQGRASRVRGPPRRGRRSAAPSPALRRTRKRDPTGARSESYGARGPRLRSALGRGRCLSCLLALSPAPSPAVDRSKRAKQFAAFGGQCVAGGGAVEDARRGQLSQAF